MISFAIQALALNGINDGWIVACQEPCRPSSPSHDVQTAQPVDGEPTIAHPHESSERSEPEEMEVDPVGPALEEQQPRGDGEGDTGGREETDKVTEQTTIAKRSRGRPRKDGTTRADDTKVRGEGTQLTRIEKKRAHAQRKLSLLKQTEDLNTVGWQKIPSVVWKGNARIKTRQARYQLQVARIAEAWTPAYTSNTLLKAFAEVNDSGEKGKIDALALLRDKLFETGIAGRAFDIHLVNGASERCDDALQEMLETERRGDLPLLASVVENRKHAWGMEEVLDFWDDPDNGSEPHGFNKEGATHPVQVWDSKESVDKDTPRVSTLQEMREIFLSGGGDPLYPINFLDLENNTPFKFLPAKLLEIDLLYAVMKAEADESADGYLQKEFLVLSEEGCWSPKHRDKMGLCTALRAATGDKTWVFTSAADAIHGDMAMCIPNWPSHSCHMRDRAVRLADSQHIFIQPPGFGHAVYTNTNSMLAGVHFYTAASFHLSILAIADEIFSDAITNDDSTEEDWNVVNRICKHLGDDRLFSKAEQSRNALAAHAVTERSRVTKRTKAQIAKITPSVRTYLGTLGSFCTQWRRAEFVWRKAVNTARRENAGKSEDGRGFIDQRVDIGP